MILQNPGAIFLPSNYVGPAWARSGAALMFALSVSRAKLYIYRALAAPDCSPILWSLFYSVTYKSSNSAVAQWFPCLPQLKKASLKTNHRLVLLSYQHSVREGGIYLRLALYQCAVLSWWAARNNNMFVRVWGRAGQFMLRCLLYLSLPLGRLGKIEMDWNIYEGF